MKKTLKNILKTFTFASLITLSSFATFASADVSGSFWTKQPNGQIYTNTGNGLGNAIINVAGCNGCGSGSGFAIGQPISGGTPTEVIYTDNSGDVYSDALFTRNPTTKATFIGLTGTNLASNFQITPTGNSLIWNADTTDNVQDIIAQSQSIGGSPFKGNGVSHLNTVTGENAYMVIGDATGIGQRPFTAILAYTSSGNTLNHEFKADDTGAAMSHRDSVADTRGYMTTFTGGNLIVWDADTTDTITTKIEQNQNILGLGGFSGTALIWQDTSTQVHGIVGAVDGTAAGLFPGSTIMATNNIATGASSSILTNYDNVLNVATAVANVSNGNFDSGFEFDDDRTVVRYRNTTTGLESSFETDATSAVTRYTADGTTEYLTQLSDGVFQFFNNTTSDQYMVLGASTGIYQFGDISGALNSTVLVVNDTSRFIDLNVESALGYSFNVTASGTSNYAQLFGSDNSDYTGIVRVSSSNTVMESQNSLLSTTNTVQTSSAAVVLSSTGSGGTSQQSLSANIFSIFNASGDQMFNLNTASIVASIGDIDAIANNTLLLVDDDNEQIEFTSRSITTNSRDIPITEKVTLTPSQVNSMNTTPIAAGISVPSGYAIQILEVYGNVAYQTTPYATNTSIAIAFSTNPTQAVWQNINILGGTNSDIRRFSKSTGSNAEVVIPNDDLVITNVAGDPTAGDSNLNVYITYKLIAL